MPAFVVYYCPHYVCSRSQHETEAAEDGAPLSDADKANMFQAALQSLQIQLGEGPMEMSGHLFITKSFSSLSYFLALLSLCNLQQVCVFGGWVNWVEHTPAKYS